MPSQAFKANQKSFTGQYLAMHWPELSNLSLYVPSDVECDATENVACHASAADNNDFYEYVLG